MPTHRDLPLTPQEQARRRSPVPRGQTSHTGGRRSEPLPPRRRPSEVRRPKVRRNHDDEIMKAAIFVAAVAVFAHAIGA